MVGDVCATNTAGTKLCVDPVNDAQNYDPTTNMIKPAPDAGVAAGGNGGGPTGAAGTGGHAGVGGAGQGGLGGKGGTGGHGGAGGQAGGGIAGGGGSGVVVDGGADAALPPPPWRLWAVDNRLKRLYGYRPEKLQTTNGDEPEMVTPARRLLVALERREMAVGQE